MKNATLNRSDLSVEKTFQGAWRVSAIVGNHLSSRQYFYCNRNEAVDAFLEEMRETANK